MDEIQLIRSMVAETELPNSDDLSPVRERLIAAARAETGPAVARRRGRRFTLVGAVAIAAAIAAVVVLAPFGGPAPSAEAAGVLRRAADVVRGLQEAAPRADQFVYTKTEHPDGVREAWQSVDGTRDGMVQNDPSEEPAWLPGCRDGKAQATKGGRPVPGRFTDCTPEPAYRPDMPTDVAAMLVFLNRNGLDDLDRSSANDRPVNGEDVAYLLRENYLSPQSRAALFEALALVPDLTLEQDERDAAGRRGVKISWPDTDDHGGGDLILDPETYTVLGSEDTAVLARGVVDQVGQRP
ncbi:CU044_5270 family protein [Lentzea roselyniae]|uniref:CU044_5270 family protein n=1 Tax=Lentzea roselyniae TaxID=531940 RepID=A0ABP7ALS5_9PSEU